MGCSGPANRGRGRRGAGLGDGGGFGFQHTCELKALNPTGSCAWRSGAGRGGLGGMLGEKADIPAPNLPPQGKGGETTQSPDTQILFWLLQSPSPIEGSPRKEGSPHLRWKTLPWSRGEARDVWGAGVPCPPSCPPPHSSQPQTIHAFECSECGAVARPPNKAPEPLREPPKEIIAPHMSSPGPTVSHQGGGDTKVTGDTVGGTGAWEPHEGPCGHGKGRGVSRRQENTRRL